MSTYRSIKNPTYFVLAAALAGLVLSKGMALSIGFCTDDFHNQYASFGSAHSLADGRYFAVILESLLDHINISFFQVYFPSIILAFIFISLFFSLSIRYVFEDKCSLAIQCSSAFLMTTFPYFTEHFLFRINFIYLCFSFCFMATAIYFIKNKQFSSEVLRVIYIILLLLAVLSTYQVHFLLVCFFVFAHCIISVQHNFTFREIKTVLYNNKNIYFSIIMSIIIYLLIVYLVAKLTGTVGRSAKLSTFIDIYEKILNSGNYIYFVMLQTEPILSYLVKALLLLGIAIPVIKLACTRPLVATSTLFIFVAIFFINILLIILPAHWWPAPRTLYGIGAAYGITFAFIGTYLKYKEAKCFAIYIICISFLCIFHSNSMFIEQQRLNKWDLWTAGQIASTIINKKMNFNKQIIISHPPRIHATGPKVYYYDINVSAFAMPWSIQALFREATGLNFNVQMSYNNFEMCQQQNIWPSPSSIFEYDNAILVCMGPR